MNRQIDPAAVPPDQFQHLENVRLIGSGVASRGGQQKFGEQLSGAIRGIFAQQFQFDEGGSGGGGTTPADRFYLGGQDSSGFPVGRVYCCTTADVVLTPAAGGGFTETVTHNDLIFTNSGGNVWVLNPNDIDAGVTFLAGFGSSIADFRSHTDGFLYVGVVSGGGGSGVWQLDTDTAAQVLEDNAITGLGGLSRMGALGDDLFAAYEGGSLDPEGLPVTAPVLRRRNSGTWSSVTLPGIHASHMACTDMVAYDGALYMFVTATYYATGTAAPDPFVTVISILKWNGTTLTSIWSQDNTSFITLGDEVTLFIGGAAQVGTDLYWSWCQRDSSIANDNHNYIGRITPGGTIANSTLYDLNAAFTVFPQAGRLWHFDGNLYYLGSLGTFSAPGDMVILRAADADLTVWSNVTSTYVTPPDQSAGGTTNPTVHLI